ncbi:hypothetical protein [Fusobacterium gastrosuis]|uniref:hypothetical protein n=1 Tax=Fusobacterium gastrosuis TaxID=1755100 RepID=UPI00297156EA|nr:hypothetical protein [Fusobacteriaceae bacterium]MDY5713662.1 hypothetical protein [Fusobacterium gastrosuis]
METEVRETALRFLGELEDFGMLNSELKNEIKEVHEILRSEKVSLECENKVFKLIEKIKTEYFTLGALAEKAFKNLE